MSAEPQLFRINPENRESEKIAEVEFASLGFQERRDIQEWVAANPGILGEDLLIIGKEFSGFDRTDERLDLLAVDADGNLVVIELKRDDTGADAHWQAIKYASYLQRASADDIIRMLAEYSETSEDDATNRLLQHLNADDLNALNNDQRIILASHRFAPEVTSAALWLNEKAPGDDLISCVQLTPYQDGEDGPLYVQASTIIPIPGVDDYIISIGESSTDNIPVSPGTSKLAQTIARNRHDEITRFLRGVSNRSIASLPFHLRPDKTSRWAGGNPSSRYWHLWYSRPFWGNWKMAYFIHLVRQEEGPSEWRAWLGLGFWDSEISDLEQKLEGLDVFDDQRFRNAELHVSRLGNVSEDAFADELSKTICRFIEVVTPKIDSISDDINE
ncbi:MAG: endonuclease NucS [Chloroflexota bacterium]|nr:endonuclease NucS [Chloroflexota bacterium]